MNLYELAVLLFKQSHDDDRAISNDRVPVSLHYLPTKLVHCTNFARF